MDNGDRVRVSLITHYYSTHRGGIELIANEFATRLAKNHGYRVEWLASNCDKIPRNCCDGQLTFSPMSAWNGIEKLWGLPWPVWSWPALRELARSVRDSSVVHVHDFIYFGSFVAVLCAFRYDKPILITQHIGHVPYKNPLLRGVLSIINRVIGAYVLGRVTQVVFVSSAVEQYFSGFVRWKIPPMLIPNGTDHGIFRPAPSEMRHTLRNQHGYSNDTPLFLFVGRFTQKKGMAFIKQFAEALPHVQWLLVGHGTERPEDWAMPNVKVHRGLSGRMLAPFYQLADLLVLPSRGEGFPLVVQEAMACGTPAFVSSETAGGSPAAGALLLHEDCSNAFTAVTWIDRLRALAAEPSRLDKLRVGVAAFAATQWDMKSCVARYDKLLGTLANLHRSKK